MIAISLGNKKVKHKIYINYSKIDEERGQVIYLGLYFLILDKNDKPLYKIYCDIGPVVSWYMNTPISELEEQTIFLYVSDIGFEYESEENE